MKLTDSNHFFNVTICILHVYELDKGMYFFWLLIFLDTDLECLFYFVRKKVEYIQFQCILKVNIWTHWIQENSREHQGTHLNPVNDRTTRNWVWPNPEASAKSTKSLLTAFKKKVYFNNRFQEHRYDILGFSTKNPRGENTFATKCNFWPKILFPHWWVQWMVPQKATFTYPTAIVNALGYFLLIPSK